MGDFYSQAFKYEMLIRIFVNCNRGARNGAVLRYLRNAMSMEVGETHAQYLGLFEKQFNKVKTYVSKALIKLSNTKKFSNSSDYFNNLNSNLEYCNSTQELMLIVDNALNKVID